MNKTKLLLSIITITIVLPKLSFAATTSNPTTFHPYYSLTAQANISSLTNPSYNLPDGFGKSNSEFGYGAGIGAGIRGDIGEFSISKLKINGLYLGIEAFINADYALHKKASRLFREATDEVESEEVKITSIFNARVNIGYNFGKGRNNNDNFKRFFDKLTIFGSIGLRHFEYESTYTYTGYTQYYMDEFIRYNDWKIAQTFGLGFIYSMSKSFDVVLGYEYSFFNIKDKIFDEPTTEGKVKIGVNTFRIGLNYLF